MIPQAKIKVTCGYHSKVMFKDNILRPIPTKLSLGDRIRYCIRELNVFISFLVYYVNVTQRLSHNIISEMKSYYYLMSIIC